MSNSSITIFATFMAKAVIEVLKKGAGIDIHISKTFNRIFNVKINGDVGSFVSVKGDYTGIIVMNFSGDAAVEIVANYLRNMGMPEEDIPTSHTSDDVRNNIGEILNQIIGSFRNLMQKKYDLASFANIPAVVPITTPIGLILEASEIGKQESMRICMSTPTSKRFYVEISMEPLKFIEISEEELK